MKKKTTTCHYYVQTVKPQADPEIISHHYDDMCLTVEILTPLLVHPVPEEIMTQILLLG